MRKANVGGLVGSGKLEVTKGLLSSKYWTRQENVFVISGLLYQFNQVYIFQMTWLVVPFTGVYLFKFWRFALLLPQIQRALVLSAHCFHTLGISISFV